MPSSSNDDLIEEEEDDEVEDEIERRMRIIGDFKHGSIKRVKLHNFLTYGDVEFQLGPR